MNIHMKIAILAKKAKDAETLKSALINKKVITKEDIEAAKNGKH